MAEASLQVRLERMEDLENIRHLKSRYHHYVNDTQFDRIGELFARDAILDLGYLMPNGSAVVGRRAIGVFFSAMTADGGPSQLKQFVSSHLVELTDTCAARGSSMLYACYGVGPEPYVVAGRYDEQYTKHDGTWLFATMKLALYFSVPLATGWAGPTRHQLNNSGPSVPSYNPLVPNPAI